MTVKIVTDSSSDIAPDLAHELDITVVPLYLRFGERVYRDGVDIEADEFYHKLETDPVHPATSAASPGDFSRTYENLAGETDAIVSIHLTGRLSATYEAALRGKEQLDASKCMIEVIDSRSLSAGLALIAIAAARAAKADESLNQIVEKVHQAMAQVRLMGILDTLKYLARGGRVGKAASLIGTALNVKPLLVLRDGEIHPSGLARTQKKGLEHLLRFIGSGSQVRDLAVAHSASSSVVQAFMERVSVLLPGIHPLVLKLGPALGVHGGSGTLIVGLREGEG